jgi:beta-lactamase class A
MSRPAEAGLHTEGGYTFGMRIRFVVLLLFVSAATAHANFREFKDFPPDPKIDYALRRTAEKILKDFPKLTENNLAMSVVDVSNRDTISRADYHGDAPFYPASVVKLFIMGEVFRQKKEKDYDVQRALQEMIHTSDNDATAFLIDIISDTCSGSGLEGRALTRFIDKRRVVNRWLNPLGYDVSAMAKPWSFGPFGRDLQLMGGPQRPNRNRATANSFASFILWILRRRAVSPEASDAMLALMARPMSPPTKDENQIKEFIGEALPPDAKLWSKAGWTSEVRHDAAYIELPSGKKWIVVIQTRGAADDVKLLPAITAKLLEELK